MKSQYVTIGEVCCLLNGFAFKSKEYVEDGIRIIRIANVQKGTIEDSTPCFYPLSKKSDVSAYMLDAGDLLVSLTGNVGRVAMLPSEMLPAALNQRVACLRVTDESVLHKQYLFHLLNSNVFEGECIESSNGAAQKNLSTSWLKKYRFLMPDFNEQIRISREFDKLLNLVEKAEVQLATYDELVKSRFIEMFGDPVHDAIWPRTSLETICSKLGSGATPRGGKSAYKDSGTPLIRSMNVHNGLFSWKDLAYIDDSQAEKLKGVTLCAGDVLLNITGASVARSCVLPSSLAGGRVNQHVAIVRANQESILPIVLNAIFTSDSYQEYLLMGSKMAGATREAITKQDLLSMTIPIPPIELQHEYASFVQQVDKLKFETQQSIEKLQMLYDSLAQEYFGS